MAFTEKGTGRILSNEEVIIRIDKWLIKQGYYQLLLKELRKAAKVSKSEEISLQIEFFKLLKNFESYLVTNVRDIMIENGLQPSDELVRSVDFGYKNKMFELLAQDYYQYVSKGRKPHARKVPVEALIQWIKDKNIPYRGSINNAAFAIQQGIYKTGIQGKLFEEEVIGFSVMAIDEMMASAIAVPTEYGLIKEWLAFKDNDMLTVKVSMTESQ